MQDPMPRFAVLARRLLSAIKGFEKAILGQVEAVTEATEAAKANQSISPEVMVRGELNLPHGVEIRKSATDALVDRKYQRRTLWVGSLTFAVAALTLIAIVVYAAISAWQLCEMRKTVQIDVDAQSPLIHVYEILLTNRMPDRPLYRPIPDEDKIKLLNNISPEIKPYIAVEFENFGNRAAIVEKMDVEWTVDETLPQPPRYSLPADYGGAVRPSGVPPIPEPIVDNRHLLDLTDKDIADITTKKSTFLWVYGFIDLQVFHGRYQKVRFCGRWHGERPDNPPEGFSDAPCPTDYKKSDTYDNSPD